LLFFSDALLPLSRLIFPNPLENFQLEKRDIKFEGVDFKTRSLILKRGISNGILEVFGLCLK
jgi:hypothetical protein